MKYPYIQFYPRDFMSDPQVSVCAAVTRGIWIDFLCVMHMNDRSGTLSGTREQLARLGRCSIEEVTTAIAELKATKTADVTECNGVVTLVCRRMKREEEARKQATLRVKKHRSKAVVTPKVTQNPLLYYGTGTGVQTLNGESEGKANGSPTVVTALMIYESYPRKVARPDALKAIGKAGEKFGLAALLEKTRAYAKASVGQDPRFIPHPATWFNQERFNDDPATWSSGGRPQLALAVDHENGF